MTVRILEHLLPDLYRCADQSCQWNDVLDRIRVELGVGSVVVQKLSLHGNRLQQDWVARDSLSLEHAEAHDCLVNNEENPRLEVDENRQPLQEVAIIHHNEAARGVRRSAYTALQERLAMLGLANPIILGIKYSKESRLSMLLHPHLGGEHRIDHRHGDFLKRLAPHLKQSVLLFEKISDLQQHGDTLAQSMNQLNVGVVVSTRRGEVRWLNSAGRDLLRRAPQLSVVDGRLRCKNASDNSVLTRVLNSVRGRELATLGDAWERPLQLLAVPVRGATEETVALYMAERDREIELCETDVIQLYNLTPAEARLAIALAEGMSLGDYAERRGKAIGTLRIQLKSIFSKLGISRQSELVSLISNSVTRSVPG